MGNWKPRMVSAERALKIEIETLEINLNPASDAKGMGRCPDQETLAAAEARLKGLVKAMEESRRRQLEFVEQEVAKWSFIARTR